MRAFPLLLCLALRAQEPPAPVERLVDAALAFARQRAQALGGEVRFTAGPRPTLPPGPSAALTFEPLRLSKQEPLGRFFVGVAALREGRRVGLCRVDLDGRWVGRLLRAKADLPRHAALDEAQVELTPFEGVPPEGALRALPSGQRLLRPLPTGRVITQGDLETPPLVRPGDAVRLTGQRGGLRVSLETTARSRGGLGDRVRLEAPGAPRAIAAIVTAAGEARLP